MNTVAKEALFRRCADQCDTTEMMSRDMVGYQTEFEEFQRLHREIEDADLEDEYQEWRKANGYIKWEEIREIPKLLTKEEFEAERKKYTDSGFRVVIFLDGNSDADIHNGIKTMVRNHWNDIS